MKVMMTSLNFILSVKNRVLTIVSVRDKVTDLE